MRNAYHISERRQVKMNNEEQIIKEKYGYNAKDMQEQMLLFMKNDTSSFLKDIAHLIETKQCNFVVKMEVDRGFTITKRQQKNYPFH